MALPRKRAGRRAEPNENYKLVMPEHLNHFGYLFGGYLLQWVDELAWIAATLDYPDCRFVTIAMDKVEFRKSVRQGTILRFRTERLRVGRTSLDYRVEVLRGASAGAGPDSVFSTVVTMVRVDDHGNKLAIERD